MFLGSGSLGVTADCAADVMSFMDVTAAGGGGGTAGLLLRDGGGGGAGAFGVEFCAAACGEACSCIDDCVVFDVLLARFGIDTPWPPLLDTGGGGGFFTGSSGDDTVGVAG